MVNIGILGAKDCGKTATFIFFLDFIYQTGNRIVQGNPGGVQKTRTTTVDFIRFSWKSQIHALYGSGGHKDRITEYYRKYVLRATDKYLCMFDLSLPLDDQFEFYKTLFPLETDATVVTYNKYDTPEGKMRLDKYRGEVTRFLADFKVPVKESFVTVAVRTADEAKYREYNQNCVKAILFIVENKKTDPFKIWDI